MESFQIVVFEQETLKNINTFIILDIVKKVIKKQKPEKAKKYALYLTNKTLMEKFPPDFSFILNSLNSKVLPNRKPLWTRTKINDIKNLLGEQIPDWDLSNKTNHIISIEEFKETLNKIDIKFIDKQIYLSQMLYKLNEKKMYSLVVVNLAFMFMLDETKVLTFLDEVYNRGNPQKKEIEETCIKSEFETNISNNYNQEKKETDIIVEENIENNNNYNLENNNNYSIKYNNNNNNINISINNNNNNNYNINNDNNNSKYNSNNDTIELDCNNKEKWSNYQAIFDIYDATFYKNIIVLSFHYSFFYNFFEYLNNLENSHNVIFSSSEESEQEKKTDTSDEEERRKYNHTICNNLLVFCEDENEQNTKKKKRKNESSNDGSNNMMIYTRVPGNDSNNNNSSNNDSNSNENKSNENKSNENSNNGNNSNDSNKLDEKNVLHFINLNELGNLKKDSGNSIDNNNFRMKTQIKYVNSTKKKKKTKRKLYIFDLIPKLDTYRKMYSNMLSLNYSHIYLISAD